MAITVGQKAGTDFAPIDAGTYLGRCYMVVDLGTHDDDFQGKKRKRHTVRLGWELPEEMKDFGKGTLEPAVVGKTYTLSLGSASMPSGLRKDLEAWRGRPFTTEELVSFDIEKLIGAPATLTVAHRDKTGGGMAAIVTAVGKMMKGAQIAPAILKPIKYEISEGASANFEALPGWLKDTIRSSDEWKNAISDAAKPDEPDPNPDDAAPTQVDDVPF